MSALAVLGSILVLSLLINAALLWSIAKLCRVAEATFPRAILIVVIMVVFGALVLGVGRGLATPSTLAGAIAMSAGALAINLVGDGLRDVFDPRRASLLAQVASHAVRLFGGLDK